MTLAMWSHSTLFAAAPAAALRRPFRCCKRRAALQQVRMQAAGPAGSSPPVAAKESSVPAAIAAVITDEAVPEGHKGLHGFLYGEGGAEAHEAPMGSYDFREVCRARQAGLHRPMQL
jgi:hypothetical protein